MATQTVYFKEREGIVGNNPLGQLLSAPQTTWWNVFGSHPLTTESLGGGGGAETVTGLKQAVQETEQGMNKQNSATHFILSPGDSKNSGDVLKAQGAFTTQSARFEFGFAQPKVCPKYPYVEQYYGVVSAYGSQMPGRIMLPLNMATEDGPIYVNAKQYHGIIRRRQSRAKAVLENKASKCRKLQQPYMHYSRHLHAMRRPRGSGGRFLNTKKLNKEKGGTEAKNADEGKQPQPSNSQNSEVLHPENGTMNSSREANGSNVSGSEVTSMDCFLGSSIHSFSGMVMPSRWVAAAMDNGCCNLKV